MGRRVTARCPDAAILTDEDGVLHRAFGGYLLETESPTPTETKRRSLAGSEAGAGAFINDTLPEITAERLRGLAVPDLP